MVTSYLSARITTLPFYDLNGLVETSDFKIALMPGSYYVDIFRLSNDSIWQKAFKTRIEPNLESYKGHSESMIYFPLNDKKTAVYDNFYSIRFDAILFTLFIPILVRILSKKIKYIIGPIFAVNNETLRKIQVCQVVKIWDMVAIQQYKKIFKLILLSSPD